MIELCSKKKMILAIAGLIVLSVIVLAIESSMSLHHDMKDASLPPGNLSNGCSEEDTVIEEECAPCSKFERVFTPWKAHDFCLATGYRELIKCKLANNANSTFYRSCPKISWMEEKNFMLFELVIAAIGVLSYMNVVYRQKRLDTMLMEKVHRQIASGV